MYLVRLMWRSASESKLVHGRYSWVSQAWRMAKPIRIISAVSNWFRRRTSHEPNRIQWIKFMWRTASESIRNSWYNSDRLSRSSRLAQPGITAVDRLWFRRRSSHEPNQIIVNRGDWLWSPANIKGANKDAKIYVGKFTTLHNLLFSVISFPDLL